MLVLLVRGSRFASSLLLTFLLSWVTLRTSLSEFWPLAFTRALPGGTALAASRPLPTKLKKTQLSSGWGWVCVLPGFWRLHSTRSSNWERRGTSWASTTASLWHCALALHPLGRSGRAGGGGGLGVRVRVFHLGACRS